MALLHYHEKLGIPDGLPGAEARCAPTCADSRAGAWTRGSAGDDRRKDSLCKDWTRNKEQCVHWRLTGNVKAEGNAARVVQVHVTDIARVRMATDRLGLPAAVKLCRRGPLLWLILPAALDRPAGRAGSQPPRVKRHWEDAGYGCLGPDTAGRCGAG